MTHGEKQDYHREYSAIFSVSENKDFLSLDYPTSQYLNSPAQLVGLCNTLLNNLGAWNNIYFAYDSLSLLKSAF